MIELIAKSKEQERKAIFLDTIAKSVAQTRQHYYTP